MSCPAVPTRVVGRPVQPTMSGSCCGPSGSFGVLVTFPAFLSLGSPPYRRRRLTGERDKRQTQADGVGSEVGRWGPLEDNMACQGYYDLGTTQSRHLGRPHLWRIGAPAASIEGVFMVGTSGGRTCAPPPHPWYRSLKTRTCST